MAGLNDVAVMSNEGGSYQFSFVLPAKDTYSGEYTADIFFVGQQTKAASVSMMHSMPAVVRSSLSLFHARALSLSLSASIYLSIYMSVCMYVCMYIDR